MFERLMLGSEGLDGLQKYWTKAEERHWFEDHPACTGQHHRRCVPLMLHGDDVQYIKTPRSALAVVSMHPELGEATTRLSRLLLAAVPLPWKTPGTLQPVLYALRWSFEACLLGVFPSADEFGRPCAANSIRSKLAGKPLVPTGWNFACAGLLSDWKFLREVFFDPPL